MSQKKAYTLRMEGSILRSENNGLMALLFVEQIVDGETRVIGKKSVIISKVFKVNVGATLRIEMQP